MKRNFLFVMLALGGILATPLTARADISHRLTSSKQLQVDAGYTSVSRAANTYSTSGNGVSTTITPSGGSAANNQVVSQQSVQQGLLLLHFQTLLKPHKEMRIHSHRI